MARSSGASGLKQHLFIVLSLRPPAQCARKNSKIATFEPRFSQTSPKAQEMVQYEPLDMGPLPAESERRSKHVQSKRRIRNFRSRTTTLIILFALIFFAITGRLRTSSFILSPRPRSPSFSTKWQSLSDAWQMPFGASDNHREESTSFHLLIPSPEASLNLCKTAFSAAILGYPSPVLINSPRRYAKPELVSSAKIHGVHDFLQNEKSLKDDDLVLVLNSHDAWFQLPPEIIINRFFDLTRASNSRLRSQYGTQVVNNITEPIFSQKILFGADKVCEKSETNSLACEAVPYAPLPEDPWLPISDELSTGHQNRPRWLNAGTIMGRVSDLRKLYSRVAERAPKDRGENGNQHAFIEIFGEQEYMRELTRQSKTNSWLDWLASKMGSQLSAPNITNLHFEPEGSKNYEFGIGLDYKSEVFFGATHAQLDLRWLSFNDSIAIAKYQDDSGTLHTKTMYLPLDIQRLPSPLVAGPEPVDDDSFSSLKPPNPPQLPDIVALSFSDFPLAINSDSATIPPILHSARSGSGSDFAEREGGLSESWWPNMWFYPYAETLLERILRASPSTPASVTVKSGVTRSMGEETFSWYRPSGKKAGGGALKGFQKWTDWEGVCGKSESELWRM